MSELLLRLDKVSVALGTDTILKDLNFELYAGQHTALLGPNGSGKSTFLRLLAGEIWAKSGAILWQGQEHMEASPLVGRSLCRLVAPKLQATYQHQGWHLSGLDLILTGFTGSNLLYGEGSKEEEMSARAIAEELQCSEFLTMDVATLSQGQLRLLLIARALVTKPKILLLDECSDGVDRPHRAQLFAVLEHVASKTTLVCATHRPKHLLACCQRTYYLHDGHLQAYMAAQIDTPNIVEPKFIKYIPQTGQLIFKLTNATVFIDGSEVLHKINWEVHQGEHWLIDGANGAGKSTLLRLLYGEECVAAGGKIERYLPSIEQERGGEISLDCLHAKVSLVSPLLESTYGYVLTGLELVLTGLENSVGVYREYTNEEIAQAREMCGLFINQESLAWVLERPFTQLSTGQVRRLFLARALMSKPDVLLLDEPCTGLDSESREHYLQLLERIACGELLGKSVTLIVIAHNLTDIPKCLNRRAFMASGHLQVEEHANREQSIHP